jgi:hypothetical protein
MTQKVFIFNLDPRIILISLWLGQIQFQTNSLLILSLWPEWAMFYI